MGSKSVINGSNLQVSKQRPRNFNNIRAGRGAKN